MTPQEINKIFARIKNLYPRFEVTQGRAQEWTRAFQSVPLPVVDKAIDRYVLTEKWAPTISEIYALVAPQRQQKQGGAVPADQSERWRYMQRQHDRGLAYIREPHPKGYRTYYIKLSDAVEVGQWCHGSLTAPRYVEARTDAPESSWGRGETWVF